MYSLLRVSLYITGFCDKKFYFCKFAYFFADSKSRAHELSNDVSFVIYLDIKHMGFRGGEGGQIDLPSGSWFSSTPAEIGLRNFLVCKTKSRICALAFSLEPCRPFSIYDS